MLKEGFGKNLIKTNLQVSWYTIEALINQWSHRSDSQKKRQRAIELTSQHSRALLQKLNVKVQTFQKDPNLFKRNYFMVSNHMSYFDILVLSSLQPSVFVTSVEMEKTFFLGDMAKLGGSFFVNRVNRRKMKDEVQALVNLLDESFNVFIFPEGTSTNGSEILPFKKSLFRVPFQTRYPILPICLKYTHINGEPFSSSNCDKVCWHGEMTFVPHLLQLMKVQEVRAEVHFLTPLNPEKFASHGDLALEAQRQIEAVYHSS